MHYKIDNSCKALRTKIYWAYNSLFYNKSLDLQGKHSR
jgi:hypothetical protein